MENASKALLMAGEVLIGIIIISILVWMFGKVQNVAEAYDETIAQREIVAFNNEYMKYITNNTEENATYIYAEDVVTIVNHARDWNAITPNSDELIQVIINTGTDTITATATAENFNFNGVEFIEKYKLRDNPTDPQYKFSCEVTLSETTGKVKTVMIESK